MKLGLMSRVSLVLSALSFFLAACSGKTEPDYFVFDPSKDYPEFPLLLSDIAEVSYIKMGGEEEGIFPNFWGTGIYVDSAHKRIFARNFSIGVMEFDTNGHFYRKLGRLGGGPGEYYTCCFYVQPEKERVGIYEEDLGKFLIYNYDGSFLADEGLDVKFINASSQSFLLQDGYLVVYNPYSIFTRTTTGVTYVWSEKTLELFSITGKEDKTIRDIHYEKPLSVPPNWGSAGRNIMASGYLLPFYSGLMMATYRSDTTYVIEKDFRWRPFLVNARHNGIEEGCLYPSAETKDYLFLCHQNNLKGGEMFYFAIDKKTKKAYKITDNDANPLPGYLQGKIQISHRGYTKNPEYRFWELSPEELKEKYYDYIPADLKSLVDQCDEDSNPILMLIRFKDVIQN